MTTTEHQASRTLVKSPPELWAECSDAGSLARHIGEFGEIRITRLEPETAVAWEGEHASGTIRIEPSGWGTRVTLTAQPRPPEVPEAAEEEVTRAEEVTDPPVDEVVESPIIKTEEEVDAKVEETAAAEPDPAVEAAAAPVRGRWKRLIARTREWFRAPATEAQEISAAGAEEEVVGPAEAVAEPEPAMVEPVAIEPAVDVGDSFRLAKEISQPEPATAEVTDAGEATEADAISEDGEGLDPDEILAAALDSLGQAHHRPFSRA